MMKLSMVLLFAVVSTPSLAAEIGYECPKEIQTEQSAVKAKVPEGWEAKRDFSFGPQALTNLSVYDGVPEEGARLVPDDEGNTNPSKTVWTFRKEKERSIWLGCEYLGTRMLLAKELPKSITSCRLLVTGKKTKSPVGVSCK